MVDVNLTTNQEDYERKLVETFIKIDAEAKHLASLAEEKKRERELIEAELLELLNDEGKKSSARFTGIGHVTCLEPVVGNAYILEGQEEVLFNFLREVGREDLIKTSVHHTSLAAFIGQRLKDGIGVPPGVGYGLKQKLRAYPEK